MQFSSYKKFKKDTMLKHDDDSVWLVLSCVDLGWLTKKEMNKNIYMTTLKRIG